jgi:hypothetical protein
VSEIGLVKLPDCGLINTVSVTFDTGGMKADIFELELDVLFTFHTCDSTIEITVPFAEMDFATNPAFWSSLFDYVATQGDYIGSYIVGPGVNLPTTVTFITGLSLGIQSVDFLVVTVGNDYTGTGESNGRCYPNQLQGTVTIPFAPDGCYVFGLYDDNYPYQSIFAFSNTLDLNNQDCFSSMWQFGSSEDAIIEGFEYYSGWMQQLRLPINGAGQKPKIEESIYRNSDGTYQRPSNYSDLTLDLHSDYLDLETRNAVFSATRCPILIFEDQSIFVSGDLDVATVQDFSNKTSYRKLAQMKFSALIQGFQPNNNACIGC